MKVFLMLTIGGLLAAGSAMAQVSNPPAARVDYARKAGFCTDPWVTIVIWFAHGSTRDPNGVGNIGECNPQLYNGGQWSTFDQLLQAYYATDKALTSAGVRMTLRDNRNGTLTVDTRIAAAFDTYVVAGKIATVNGANLVTHVVSTGAGNVLGNSGAGVVGTGGGSVVSTGAGNIVSHDGGTLIGQDGAGYMVMLANRVKVKLPGGRAMIIGR